MTSAIPIQCSLPTELLSQLGADHLVLRHIRNPIFYCKRRRNFIHTAHHYSLFLLSFILLIHVATTTKNRCYIHPYLPTTDTSLQWAFSPDPKVAVVNRFNCITKLVYKEEKKASIHTNLAGTRKRL